MTPRAALAALLLATLSTPSHLAGTSMPDTPSKPALYQILSRRPDGACIWATMLSVRAGGDPVQALFCNPDDVAYLRDETPRHRMATLLAKNGAAQRLLPVTVGLDVSIMSTDPAGNVVIAALPRPAPLRLPADRPELRELIAAAARDRKPVAFALADPRTVIDAAPIERSAALAMLGLQETPPR
jgi:hypothetical protein